MVGFCVRYNVPEFVRLNRSVFLTRNELVVRAQGCAFGMPLGALVLRITRCVRDDKEKMIFRYCVFHKNKIPHALHYYGLT